MSRWLRSYISWDDDGWLNPGTIIEADADRIEQDRINLTDPLSGWVELSRWKEGSIIWLREIEYTEVIVYVRRREPAAK